MPTANTATSAKTQQQQADNKSKSFQQTSTKQSTKQSSTKQSTGEESVSSTSHQSETNVDQLSSNNQETNMTTNNVASNTGGAAAASGVKTPPEQPEFIKQALIIIEKKVRNLEKRRQKLEEYRETQRKGTVLNEDQLSAVSRYDEVIRTLDLSREMEKQFIGLANDAMKQQKKQTKKEQLEREELIRERIKESQKYLAVLDTFGDDTIRNDFLNELNGANKLTQNEMNLLDEFNRLVKPAELGAKLEASTTDIADHLTNLIDSKNKTIASMNVTYFELRKLFDRILFSSYWTRVVVVAPPATTTTTSTSKEEHNVNPIEEQHNELEQNMNKLHLTEQQIPVELVQQQHEDVHLHQQQQQQSLPIEQALYHQQNTSDDYVLVSSTDENLANNQSKSPNNQQGQAKTFFTTLNQADLPPHRNINEFLNKCENDDDGINFLQDSEIQLRQQQDHLNQNELNYQQQQGGNNFNYNQDGSHPEGQQKDNQFKQRGGNRDHNGGQNQRQYQQRPRYTDDRRMGGTGGQGGMQQPRNNGINGPLPPRNNISGSNQTSFNGQRNPSNSYRGGSAQGNNNNNNYNNNNNNNNNNRGGYNRGPSNNNQGSGFRNNNGPRPYQQQQRVNNHSENVHENQQPQMA